ncbi:ribonuclease HII [Nocardioides cavernaquae]|uniref:Ribonuclease HII n=1 Tax=Nocardioides cavernaquae TaxID=2321396 RepID=A0A3A5H2A0_9ACTN|nr:ribonuclease HII [Nocardioides cavernaquae]RJS44936.1 ribonuclease HII [Nocardioides cavernaquae]
MSPTIAPSLRFERRLLREGVALLAAADEVGRGALCGPVTVGMVLIDESTRSAPSGVRDSKLLTASARQQLVPRIQRWAMSYGVGHASPVEIDEFGLTAALRLAGQRALAQLAPSAGVVLLDGNHDYLSTPEQDALFGSPAPVVAEVPRVVTMIKADLKCSAVAAASVLAKTARDALLIELAEEFPHYGWAENKGYSAPEHLAALATHGPTRHHRLSWRLPGCADVDPAAFRRAAGWGVHASVQNVREAQPEETR